MSAYRIEPPFAIKFSGGRTSGYMLGQVLAAWNGTLPDGAYVLFANTGLEHERTLDFIMEVEKRWCPVTWLEWRAEDPKWAMVTADTASRKGEPFTALLRKYKHLPNPVQRFCTGHLKRDTMHRYLRHLGHDPSEVADMIGLRYDEPQRVARLRGDTSRNIVLPLADSKVTRDAVESWWKQQPFDLRLPNNDNAFGNCDCCFLKSRDRIDRVLQQEPDKAQWWIDMEQEFGMTFRKDRASYRDMLTPPPHWEAGLIHSERA